VPTLDDDRFEAYLKTFRPIVPDALPSRANTQRSWRRMLLRSAVAAAAAVIFGVVGFNIVFNVVKSRVTEQRSNSASLELTSPKRPLTMQDANELLARAPSYKSAIDNLVFPRQGSVVPKDKQSAIAVLGKEKIKL
jgi:hypothetical protein